MGQILFLLICFVGLSGLSFFFFSVKCRYQGLSDGKISLFYVVLLIFWWLNRLLFCWCIDYLEFTGRAFFLFSFVKCLLSLPVNLLHVSVTELCELRSCLNQLLLILSTCLIFNPVDNWSLNLWIGCCSCDA